MPPEVEGLWAKTKKANYGDRIWPDSLVGELKKPSPKLPDSNCGDIESNFGLHMLNLLPKIGVDFGKVSRNTDGTLISDKQTETLQHVDFKAFTRTMINVEAGIADPKWATKYSLLAIQRGAEVSGGDSDLPDVSASGKVRRVLVGLPIMQNLWAALDKDTISTTVFAQKMTWFFVANIVWAVYHAIDEKLPPEDLILGLLSSFDYNGKWLTFSNLQGSTRCRSTAQGWTMTAVPLCPNQGRDARVERIETPCSKAWWMLGWKMPTSCIRSMSRTQPRQCAKLQLQL